MLHSEGTQVSCDGVGGLWKAVDFLVEQFGCGVDSFAFEGQDTKAGALDRIRKKRCGGI